MSERTAENGAPICEGHLEAPRHTDCPFLHPHQRHTLGHHRVIPPAKTGGDQ